MEPVLLYTCLVNVEKWIIELHCIMKNIHVPVSSQRFFRSRIAQSKVSKFTKNLLKCEWFLWSNFRICCHGNVLFFRHDISPILNSHRTITDHRVRTDVSPSSENFWESLLIKSYALLHSFTTLLVLLYLVAN